MLAYLRRPPLLARCPLPLYLWRRADRNPATLPDDSASLPALQSIDRLLCSSQSMAQLLLRCSLVFYLFLKLPGPHISEKLEIFFLLVARELCQTIGEGIRDQKFHFRVITSSSLLPALRDA